MTTQACSCGRLFLTPLPPPPPPPRRSIMVGGKLVPAEEPSHLKAKSDNKYFGEGARASFFKLYQKAQ